MKLAEENSRRICIIVHTAIVNHGHAGAEGLCMSPYRVRPDSFPIKPSENGGRFGYTLVIKKCSLPLLRRKKNTPKIQEKHGVF